MNKTINVKLVKSTIGTNSSIRSTVLGLGLKKINQTRELKNIPEVRGMIKKVIHLLEIKE